MAVDSLRRLFAAGRSASGAAGASLLFRLQTPTLWSDDADRIRAEGAWTARLSTDDL